ncbi:NUDIX hydrolase [Corynebacterium sp. H128]|uniref:NUDIX hydrolase n=1 Tax=unclassified Corynebacterium TaxID=2624378 RepID=UPI0030A8B3FF
MKGDGDGWSAGPGGSRRWGKFGAAGLFLVSTTTRTVLMQHRAHWTADGGTWGIPGGARDSHETAAEAAMREAVEETGISTASIAVIKELTTDGPFAEDPQRPELSHGWTYATVVAMTPTELPVVSNEESLELRWVPLGALQELNLLPAFQLALPEILAAVPAP